MADSTKKSSQHDRGQQQKRDRLEDAIHAQNIEQVRDAISYIKDINAIRFPGGVTPLMLACKYDNLDIIKLLIRGSDIDAVDDNHMTALFYASLSDKIDAIDLLIDAKIDINIRNRHGLSALMSVYAKKKKEMAYTLIDRGADLDIRDRDHGMTILMTACIYNDEEMVRRLIKKGADVSIRDNEGRMAITMTTDAKIIKMLEIQQKMSVLQGAIKKSDLKQVQQILSSMDADAVNARSTSGWTPLMLAVATDNIEMINLLINRGADIEAKNNDGETAFSCAVIFENIDAIKELIRHHVNVNTQNNDGTTPLMFAISTKRIDILNVLIENGADITIEAKNGNTAVSIAKHTHNDEIITILQRTHKNALQIARKTGNTEQIDKLVSRQQMTLDTVLSYLFLAIKHDDLTYIRQYQETNPELFEKVLNKPYHQTTTLLTYAILEKKNKIVAYLCQIPTMDVNILAPESIKQTPLTLTIIENNKTIMDILCDRPDLDLNKPDNTGTTPLMIARAKKNKDAIQLLLDTGRKQDYRLNLNVSVLDDDDPIIKDMMDKYFADQLKYVVYFPGEIGIIDHFLSLRITDRILYKYQNLAPNHVVWKSRGPIPVMSFQPEQNPNCVLFSLNGHHVLLSTRPIKKDDPLIVSKKLNPENFIENAILTLMENKTGHKQFQKMKDSIIYFLGPLKLRIFIHLLRTGATYPKNVLDELIIDIRTKIGLFTLHDGSPINFKKIASTTGILVVKTKNNESINMLLRSNVNKRKTYYASYNKEEGAFYTPKDDKLSARSCISTDSHYMEQVKMQCLKLFEMYKKLDQILTLISDNVQGDILKEVGRIHIINEYLDMREKWHRLIKKIGLWDSLMCRPFSIEDRICIILDDKKLVCMNKKFLLLNDDETTYHTVLDKHKKYIIVEDKILSADEIKLLGFMNDTSIQQYSKIQEMKQSWQVLVQPFKMGQQQLIAQQQQTGGAAVQPIGGGGGAIQQKGGAAIKQQASGIIAKKQQRQSLNRWIIQLVSASPLIPRDFPIRITSRTVGMQQNRRKKLTEFLVSTCRSLYFQLPHNNVSLYIIDTMNTIRQRDPSTQPKYLNYKTPNFNGIFKTKFDAFCPRFEEELREQNPGRQVYFIWMYPIVDDTKTLAFNNRVVFTKSGRIILQFYISGSIPEANQMDDFAILTMSIYFNKMLELSAANSRLAQIEVSRQEQRQMRQLIALPTDQLIIKLSENLSLVAAMTKIDFRIYIITKDRFRDWIRTSTPNIFI